MGAGGPISRSRPLLRDGGACYGCLGGTACVENLASGSLGSLSDVLVPTTLVFLVAQRELTQGVTLPLRLLPCANLVSRSNAPALGVQQERSAVEMTGRVGKPAFAPMRLSMPRQTRRVMPSSMPLQTRTPRTPTKPLMSYLTRPPKPRSMRPMMSRRMFLTTPPKTRQPTLPSTWIQKLDHATDSRRLRTSTTRISQGWTTARMRARSRSWRRSTKDRRRRAIRSTW